MKITLHNLGRRFNQEWVFKGIDYTFSSNNKYAILGPNGSGKSTLLRVLTGQLTPSQGLISFTDANAEVHVDDIYNQVAIAAPYIELIEEFTLGELVDFHFSFKDYLPGFNRRRLVKLLNMEKYIDKRIQYFSSGMKQRVKLALACCCNAKFLFLDEPTSNLDREGEDWYLNLMENIELAERVLIVGSNQEKEYSFCNHFIQITDYKNFKSRPNG